MDLSSETNCNEIDSFGEAIYVIFPGTIYVHIGQHAIYLFRKWLKSFLFERVVLRRNLELQMALFVGL